MRAHLVNGKIIPPTDPHAAQSRLQQLRYEIEKTENQIDDPGRISKYVTMDAYDAWCAKAKAAVKYMRREAEQLEEWLEEKAAEDFWKE